MANKKKIATAAVAVATAASLLLGGTFAWQSISQTALNEASDVINPGGRLHDDFNGSNKDVYVENFAEDPIFARVRLDEYFEIVMNKGTGAEKTEVVTKYEDEEGNPVDAVKGETDTYVTHLFGETNATDEYWTWTTGGSTIYMPTFNMNKDSLEADINGTYEGPDGTDGVKEGDEADRYLDNEVYTDGDPKTGTEIYDADTNGIDEIAQGTAELGVNYKEVQNEHTAKPTLDATLINMEEWKNLEPDDQVGNYWVYDTDGWVYWAQPIEGGTATGLLLDGIELAQVMDDSWYYAINVVAQFVTADDLGKTDGTGFYDTDKGTAPSADALDLLEKIGVNVPITTADELKEALNESGVVDLGDVSITSNVGETQDGLAGYTYNYLWTEGGELNGGTLTTSDANFGLFVNNENNWPVSGDGAKDAVINGTTIESTNSSAALYAQTVHAPLTLNDITITSSSVGLYSEYAAYPVILNNATITSTNNAPAGMDWLNSAVAVSTSSDDNAGTIEGHVVINSGTYTGKYAVYVFSSGGIIEINGGYFDGMLKADAEKLVINGGTFTADPTEFVDPATHEVVTNEDGTYTVQEIGSTSDEEYDLVLTADGRNSLNVALGDPIKIKVDDGIQYDRIRLNIIYSDGESNLSKGFVLDGDMITIKDESAVNKNCTLVAQVEKEVVDEENGETYSEYETVALAGLNISHRYEFRYNGSTPSAISISADDFVSTGIQFTLWDTVDNAEADDADYARVDNYVISQSSESTRDLDDFGIKFDKDTRTLKIDNTAVKDDEGNEVSLANDDYYYIDLTAEEVLIPETEEDSEVIAELALVNNIMITITDTE